MTGIPGKGEAIDVPLHVNLHKHLDWQDRDTSDHQPMPEAPAKAITGQHLPKRDLRTVWPLRQQRKPDRDGDGYLSLSRKLKCKRYGGVWERCRRTGKLTMTRWVKLLSLQVPGPRVSRHRRRRLMETTDYPYPGQTWQHRPLHWRLPLHFIMRTLFRQPCRSRVETLCASATCHSEN